MRTILVILALLTAAPAAAQWSFGPQIGGLGIGGSVTRSVLFGVGSISAEGGFAPVGTTTVTFEGVEYTLEPNVSGGLAMVSVHPLRNNFALSAGYLIGGYRGDARTPDESGAYVLDGQTYTIDEYGPLRGTMKLQGPVPAFMLGWRGAGFNFGVGVALTEPEVSLSADGPMASSAAFQAALERERADLESSLQVELFGVRGVPLIRLGWELGL